jgi:MFS family permease
MNMDQQVKESLFRDKNIYIIFSITLLAIMGVASLTPAFPEIIRQFNISAQEIGLLITVFTLPGIILSPVMGILADRLGRKTILIPSIFIFGICGFLCAFTKEYNHLLILRFLQGIGAATLGMLNITLVGDIYTGIRRATVMGYNASILNIGTAAFPALGGALAVIAWYYPFYIPLLSFPVGIFVILRLKNPEPTKKQAFVTYLRNTWASINRKEVWGLFIINILVFVILYGSLLTFFPLFLEENFNANAFIIGMAMSIMSIITAFISSQLGRLSQRFSPRTLLIYSSIFYLTSMIILPLANSWFLVFLSILFFALGHGTLLPNIFNLLVGFASINERAGFMSINSMVLRIGQTIGPILIALVYNLGGLNATFFAGAAVAALMIIIIVSLISNSNKT